MRHRGALAAAVLTTALISGGWLMERGSRSPLTDVRASAKLFDDVLRHLRRDYVDTIPDSTLYRHAIDGALRELNDPHTVFLSPRRLSRLDESTSGKYAGVDMQPLQIDGHFSGAYCIVESTTEWITTGAIVAVSEVIGLQSPTPARRGARAWCEWKSRAGWCVTAIEPRDFGDYGLFN